MDGGDFILSVLLGMIIGVVLIFALISKEDRIDNAQKCDKLYTTYAKTTADTLWFVNTGICKSPTEVKKIISIHPATN